MNADGSNVRRLTDGVDDSCPAWSVDGSHIVFEAVHEGAMEIFVMTADSSEVTNLTNSPSTDRYPSWTRLP